MRQAQQPQIPPPGTSDADLVQRALARDEAAVRAILQANNRRLYRLARGILRNDSEAEDVVQETYVRAFTHLETFRGDSSLSTWLGRIAGHAGSPDHPVSQRGRRRRSGKIHGPA